MNFTTEQEKNYWTQRYEEGKTGWDIGRVSTPLKEYIDQLQSKKLKILIPGAGNAYEAAYLHEQGFANVWVLDISEIPLQQLAERVPSFPKERLLQSNFFEHQGSYDLILEQTFFCSFEPTTSNRSLYAKHMAKVLSPNGKLVGLWFKHTLDINGNRPFGGSKEEYLAHLSPYFEAVTFEDCYNSIPPRAGNELFGIFCKK